LGSQIINKKLQGLVFTGVEPAKKDKYEKDTIFFAETNFWIKTIS